MIDPAEEQEAPDDLAPKEAPPKPKKKMALKEQAQFLHDLRTRCQLLGRDDAGATYALITEDDAASIACIVETIDLFTMYGADRFVRDAIARGKKPGAR